MKVLLIYILCGETVRSQVQGGRILYAGLYSTSKERLLHVNHLENQRYSHKFPILSVAGRITMVKNYCSNTKILSKYLAIEFSP